jgi:ORF6N domain
MFRLSSQELADLRSQTVISSAGHGAPYAFTEQGVAMLSSVLSSPRAIAVNIEIMRTFVRVRALAATHGDLAQRLADLENTTEALAQQHDTFSRNTRAQLKQVFDALRELMTPPEPPKRPIGFVTPEDKGKKPTSSKRKT